MIPVIVGPTGSGKTAVSVKIAKAINGEIISADSRTIYIGMDVGTAKPSMAEREGVPHFGFDLVNPSERFTVKDWKDYAEEKISEIESRRHVAMVVGGTGLYVDALVFDYKFEVAGKGYDENRGECIKNLNGKTGSLSTIDSENYPDRVKMCADYVVFGIKWDPEQLRERLFIRADTMFDEPLYEETQKLVDKYGFETKALTGDIYRYAWRYMKGEISREEAVKLTAICDWHLAKRQMTWFKRNDKILWFSLENIEQAVLKCVQDEQRK